MFFNFEFMNKGRRHELKMLKYRKRLKLYGLKEGDNGNLHAFRSHGAPCSCSVCSHSKYNRSAEKNLPPKEYKEEIKLWEERYDENDELQFDELMYG